MENRSGRHVAILSVAALWMLASCQSSTPDSCDPDPCSGHGTCSQGICTCLVGYAGASCNQCASGYTGYPNCVDVPCVPNPCTEPHKGQCNNNGGTAVCSCDAGYHDEAGTCVEDTECAENTCNGHGICNHSTGVPVCTCAVGYMGDHCESCAQGYHWNGANTACTQDPCDPNLCTDSHKGQCNNNGGTAVCSCDAGYHDEAGVCVLDQTSAIIADHTIVDRYDDIPQEYINLVKKMWFNVPGESHSSGYRKGLQFLEDMNAQFDVNVTESGNPEAYTDQHLRVSGAYRNQYSNWSYGTGESNWYTNAAGITATKSHLEYCNTNSLVPAAVGFGWCWDMTWNNAPGGTMDPVYKVRWAGSSEGGAQGNLRWGLDADDQVLTGNSVCLDTYLAATQAYIDHCTANGYTTKVFFTTGPVDGYAGESGYQRQLKHDRIRSYVAANSSRILFDYADILAWSDSGVQNLQTWTDSEGGTHSYQMIHADNMKDQNDSYVEDGDHIGERGAIRLGKAVWWMLARIAGWDGN